MSEIIKLSRGDIVEFNDPQTTEDILDARNNGTKYPNQMLILNVPDNFDVKYMYQNNLIDDDCIFFSGIDRHGHILSITVGEWMDDNFRIVGHKDPDNIINYIFGTGK